MMDVEKMIERLEAWNEQHLSVVCGNGHFACDYLCENEDCIVVRAATALSTLQAENAQLRESRNHWKRLAHELSEGVNGKDAEHERLQAENEKLRVELQESEYDSVELQAELERVKQLYETEKENFIDFACSGVPNLSPYCLNRHPDCVDERGWCKTEKCRGFSRERGQKEN